MGGKSSRATVEPQKPPPAAEAEIEDIRAILEEHNKKARHSYRSLAPKGQDSDDGAVTKKEAAVECAVEGAVEETDGGGIQPAEDVVHLSNFYTDDVRLMVPGRETIIGVKDIVGVMSMLASQGFDWNVTIDETGPLGNGGDMVYERGRTEWAHEDPSKTHHNKYLVLRKKVDGKYLVHTLIFNDSGSEGPSHHPSTFQENKSD